MHAQVVQELALVLVPVAVLEDVRDAPEVVLVVQEHALVLVPVAVLEDVRDAPDVQVVEDHVRIIVLPDVMDAMERAQEVV